MEVTPGTIEYRCFQVEEQNPAFPGKKGRLSFCLVVTKSAVS
jgi:hypothetical protein